MECLTKGWILIYHLSFVPWVVMTLFKQSLNVAQVRPWTAADVHGMEFLILLPIPPTCWAYRLSPSLSSVHKEHSFVSFVSMLYTHSSEFPHLVTGRCSNAFWVEGRWLFSPMEILNGYTQLCPLWTPLQLILHIHITCCLDSFLSLSFAPSHKCFDGLWTPFSNDPMTELCIFFFPSDSFIWLLPAVAAGLGVITLYFQTNFPSLFFDWLSATT